MHVTSLEEQSGTRIGVCLVRKLKNVKYLRKKILTGQLNCCAVKPTLVADLMQIVVAAKRAVSCRDAGKLTTKSLNSELLFNLSASKNITQSLSKFGIADNDDSVIVVVFEEEGENKLDSIRSEIEGEECELSELQSLSDAELIKKTYKITDTELQVSSLADSVISRIATKEFGSV